MSPAGPPSDGGVGGLPDARMLVGRIVPSWLNERVRDRFLFEARGNPLALLELPRAEPSAIRRCCGARPSRSA
ncbi:hypothetical protein [Actinomadura sp. 9N407]|uniref:hypothetical protein n=1 Tax=Actinomadura sp. 9N407 TaxID=3375154 RepID=UPI0037875A26